MNDCSQSSRKGKEKSQNRGVRERENGGWWVDFSSPERREVVTQRVLFFSEREEEATR